MKTKLLLRLPKGFTLIELLVVISIIGILVAVAITSYTGAQIKARDVRRRADMKNTQAMMEQYYATTGNNFYPATVSTAFSPNVTPVDPKNSGTYDYTTYDIIPAALTSYCICALLEETGKGNANTPVGGGGACTWNAAGNYFCVSNQQ